MFCTKCGKPLAESANFCGHCGYAVGPKPGVSAATPITKKDQSVSMVDATPEAAPKPASIDLSWTAVVANVWAILAVAYATYPIPSELRSDDALLYLSLRSGMVFGVALLFSMFGYATRRDKGSWAMRRIFVIIAWIVLGLLVMGEKDLGIR